MRDTQRVPPVMTLPRLMNWGRWEGLNMGDMPANKLHVVTTVMPVPQAARRSRTYWRLLACALNAAIWVTACELLEAGWLASLFAGIIGFLAAAMIVGASRDLHH